jgi:hypothetical protein
LGPRAPPPLLLLNTLHLNDDGNCHGWLDHCVLGQQSIISGVLYMSTLIAPSKGIDDNLIVGSKKAVEKAKKDIMERFECKDCGDLEEYVGCTVVRTENSLKFTQPVLMQSYSNEFKLPTRSYKTPVQTLSQY